MSSTKYYSAVETRRPIRIINVSFRPCGSVASPHGAMRAFDCDLNPTSLVTSLPYRFPDSPATSPPHTIIKNADQVKSTTARHPPFEDYPNSLVLFERHTSAIARACALYTRNISVTWVQQTAAMATVDNHTDRPTSPKGQQQRPFMHSIPDVRQQTFDEIYGAPENRLEVEVRPSSLSRIS